MAIIQYSTFIFVRPPCPSESEFEILKRQVVNNPRINITPLSQGFFRTFKFEILYLGTGILGLFITFLDFAKWLNVIGGIAAFLAFFGLFSFVPSFYSYFIYVLDKRRHYNGVRRDLISTTTYGDFCKLQEKRRWKSY